MLHPGFALIPATRKIRFDGAFTEAPWPGICPDAVLPRAWAGLRRARGCRRLGAVPLSIVIPPAVLNRIATLGRRGAAASPGRIGWQTADVIGAAPSVHLELESRPETVTLVHGMLGGVAEVLALERELLDDLKTAVSEACNNVVLHAYSDRTGLLAVLVYVEEGGIEVLVRDQSRGISRERGSRSTSQGVGLPVIRALTVRSQFLAAPGGGTEVRMLFAGSREGRRLFESPGPAVAATAWPERLAGDAVVSVSPVLLLTGVLGRLARALAATARLARPVLRCLPGHGRNRQACRDCCQRGLHRLRDPCAHHSRCWPTSWLASPRPIRRCCER